MPKDPAPLLTDMGPFALVPAWLLWAGVSDRAIRLYAVLARRADNETGASYPSRPTLAAEMGCSVDKIDRAKGELVAIKALEVAHRANRTSNIYTVRRNPPDLIAAPLRPPSRESAATNSRTTAALSIPRELDLPLDPPANAGPSSRRRTDPRADNVVKVWWGDQNPKPLQKFVTIRGIVSSAIVAGHTPEAVLAALWVAGREPPIVAWKLEKALAAARRPTRGNGDSVDYDAISR